MAASTRDPLAELDSVEQYLADLIGSDPMPGQDSNLQRLGPHMAAVRDLAQNIVDLAAEYAAGRTHEERVAKSMGVAPPDSAAQARIAELEAQLAAARSGSDG